MTCGIYCITNNITGKQYIGLSDNIERRFKEHCYHGKKGSYIDRSISKYGPDAFDFDIIHVCNEDELEDEEQKFISLYGTCGGGYNLTRGGDFNGMGNPMNYPELRKKVSESLKGRKIPPELSYRIGMSNSKANNSVGYYRVSKKYSDEYRIGYMYVYSYRVKGKQKSIADSSLLNLEKKVISKDLPWVIVNPDKAKNSLNENLNDLKNIRDVISLNTTGFYRVSKIKNDSLKIGYYFQYNDNASCKSFRSINIHTLEENVKSAGWPWKVLNEKLAEEITNSNMRDLENAEDKPHANTGRCWSEDELHMLSKANTSTGIYKVSKTKNKKSRIGYYFTYYYHEEGNSKTISNSDICKLEKKVKERNLPWIILDESKYSKTYNQNLEDLKNKKPLYHKNNISGYYGVTVHKCTSCKQGFTYQYRFYKEGKRFTLASISLENLKEKVLSRNLDWFKIRDYDTIDSLSDDEIRKLIN